MTGWVLILMMGMGPSIATTSATFEDEAACVAAGKQVVDRGWSRITFVCAPAKSK